MSVRSAHMRLLVSDFEACFQFYRDTIGFDVITEDIQGGYAELRAGDMRFDLFRRQEMAQIIGSTDKPSRADCQDNVALIISVPDLEETYQQLTRKGIQFTTAPINNPYYGIKTAYLRDPDGTLIGLFQLVV